MKKCIVGISAIFAFALTVKAQEITFLNLEYTSPSGEVSKDVYDFGRIEEAAGLVGAEIEFINSGKQQLMINNIRSSCPSCIRVEWKQHPIAAGGKGRIKVFFNPLDRPGKFFKTVTIESNAKQVYKFRVTGEVIPKTAESTESYSVKMGELNLQTKEINFGIIKKGQKVRREIEYANLSDHDINVELLSLNEEYLLSFASLSTVKPQETGKFIFLFDADACKQSGLITTSVLVVLNKNQQNSEEFRINIQAEVDNGSTKQTITQ